MADAALAAGLRVYWTSILIYFNFTIANSQLYQHMFVIASHRGYPEAEHTHAQPPRAAPARIATL